jgi:hypothetical protein
MVRSLAGSKWSSGIAIVTHVNSESGHGSPPRVSRISVADGRTVVGVIATVDPGLASSEVGVVEGSLGVAVQATRRRAIKDVAVFTTAG